MSQNESTNRDERAAARVNHRAAGELQQMREEMARMRNEMQMLQASTQQGQQATLQSVSTNKIRKGDPPSFSGKDKEDVEKFIFLTEEFYFEYDDVRTAQTEQFARIVMSNLKSDASTWFQNFTEVSRAEGHLRTWDHMKTQLRLQFGKADDKMKAIEKVLRAKQKGSVQEFSNYLTTHMLRSGEQWPEQIKIGILRVSLRKNLSDEISRRLPTSMAEAIKIAKAEEGRTLKNSNPKEIPSENGNEETKKKVPTCYACGKKGHKKPDCTASEEIKAKYKASYKKEREEALRATEAPKNN